MRKFNEEDYELVKGYESHFTRAIKSRYCTGLLTSDLELISKIYRQTLNRQVNLSCSGCVLQMMTSVGRLYFAYKTEREKEQEVIQPVKKKRTYKKSKNKEESKNVSEDKIEAQDSEGRVVEESNNQ